ncbi:nidogen-2 isoform X2 [Orussus abietinus]|uniref:nidogen-2 isoform X2 n=1 Tax=Orussus abietinus TaxID=222816 RepID=UPI0006254198|nr:nidogen-2 isoform X2 [Orussus abietinus]
MARGASFFKIFFVVGILASRSSALSKDEFYPYTFSGSASLEADPDGQLRSAETVLKTPVVFYDKVYNTLFVNGNGVISFVRAMQRFFNIAFPLDEPVIAPLYTHVDTRGSGMVFWGETDNPDILARAGGIVRSAFKDTDYFEPTHVFLATWVNVGYYREKSDKVNTYQAAIISNGTHSYVELLYPEGGIQWIQGESHPNGLPDARAQAGLMSEGKMYTLKGSGTDQIQNIDKWSNVNRPGQWVFQVGPLTEGENVKTPDKIYGGNSESEIATCVTGATTCHSKANCIDHEAGFCCSCKQGYFGNGKSCQPNDVPLRVIGRISGNINNEEFPSRDLQCYVQTKDGRTYTAISRIPEALGSSFQLLGTLGGVIGWLFAKPIGNTKNGYQLTGGVFNHTSELSFTPSGEHLTIRSRYMGLDVFGQLKMEADIKGTIPVLAQDARIDYGDHEEPYTRVQPGTIRSQTTRTYKIIGESDVEHSFNQDQIIVFEECPYEPGPEEDTTRLKFSRGVTTFEARESIIRFAMNSKVAPLEEEDPCIQGRSSCGVHSSCVVDGDEFKCVCNPGYQYLYERDGNATCVDINECTAGNHVCAPDAYCVNNEGSHTCHCKTGFSGDGRICEKIPTCEETRCLDYEQCTMISGLPVCSCLPGFENTDDGCFPIQHESCDVANNCSPYGSCSYNGDRGLYVCVCLPGYVGDGYTCYTEAEAATTVQPIDERPQCVMGTCWCSPGWDYRNNVCVKIDENFEIGGPSTSSSGDGSRDLSCNVVNRCHPYAQCVYVISTGDYECRCNQGYEGDGMECTRMEVSCLDIDICDPNASCRHEEPSAKCVCNPGYEGDGMSCHPIDECTENSECDENEQCSYNPSAGRYECTCNPGFGMVDGQCVVADCSTNPSQCHVNGQCITGDVGYKCVCMSGFHGDGVHQCVTDHIGCNVLNNCDRNAVCGYNQTAASFACICQPGYHGNGFTCLPQSSCRRNPGLCSKDATCVGTGEDQFACVCNEGFSGDGASCKSVPRHDANILLVNQGMATLRIPFYPTPANPSKTIHIVYEQMAVALDIDCQAGKVYYSDISGNRLVAMTYNGSTADTFLVNVSSPEGLSIDWVSRNIFWTDSGKTTVEVANLETKKRKVLISDGLVNPRGIAVHPYRGKIFWSDWNRHAPKLEWANEDGTGRSIFLHGSNVQLPNSLAIDWSTDQLCWADAGTFTIHCASIDTRELQLVAKDLAYPFGLAISQNHYYWTDWKTHKIEIAGKVTKERLDALNVPPGGNGKLYGVVAVPETCPRVSNVCQFENGRCTKDQLCLPDGQGGRTCVCADNASGPCINSGYSS